jgi:hypothetical protein
MKQRQFIKVVATSITGVDGGRLESSISRGITNLKRGQTVADFVTAFLRERGIQSFTLHERGDGTWATAPMMFLNEVPKRVLTYTFTVFPQDDLGFYAKDLSAGELERDMKPLAKLIYKA